MRLPYNGAGDRIGAVPDEKIARGASRYDAIIATLVGFCALCVSIYTAYMQRQQVRAAVWPILEFDSGNGPVRFTVANKGVGSAIIKHVIVKVDDQAVKNWAEVLQKILWPGYHRGEESDMSGRVFAAGESMNVFPPHDDAQNPIPFDKSNRSGQNWIRVAAASRSRSAIAPRLANAGLARRRDNTKQDDADPLLSGFVSNCLSAITVVRLFSLRASALGDSNSWAIGSGHRKSFCLETQSAQLMPIQLGSTSPSF